MAFPSAGMVSSIAISSTSLGFVTTAWSQPNDVKRIFPPSVFSQVSVPLSAFFKISCVFHGGPWSQNSPIDENGAASLAAVLILSPAALIFCKSSACTESSLATVAPFGSTFLSSPTIGPSDVPVKARAGHREAILPNITRPVARR